MATGWIEVFVTRDPDEAELAQELLRNNGISSRLDGLPTVRTVEGLGSAARISLEVLYEDKMSASHVLDEGMR